MNAEFFTQQPQSAAVTAPVTVDRRARHVHRWVATIFTITVVANFAAMPWGRPPAWLTYAPLAPLFFLMATGLFMLATTSRRAGGAR